MDPDGVKKVWNDVNKLYDKIPNSVKFTIGAVGVAATVVTGAAPLGAAVGVLAGAMLGGAAMNAGIYAAGAFFGYHDFSWKEMGKTALDGAADGALFAGVGLTIAGVTRGVMKAKNLLSKNGKGLKGSVATETVEEGSRHGMKMNLQFFAEKGETYYHVTTEENAKMIMQSEKLGLSNNNWEKRVFAWTEQPTKKQASIAGIGKDANTVLKFNTRAVFEPDVGNVGKSIENIVVQTIDSQRVPISVSNIESVGFKKEWWEFWKK